MTVPEYTQNGCAASSPDKSSCHRPKNGVKIVEDVQAVLGGIAGEVQAFADRAGIACPAGCGACCHSPNVEAMPVEMLPMAKQIIESGVFPDTSGKTCPMFRAHPTNPSLGRCGAYHVRPSVCRIFPYGFSRDKNGEARWRPCSKMTVSPESLSVAMQDVASGHGISYERARLALQDLVPSLAERLPINEALAEAIQFLGLRMDNEPRQESPHVNGGS